MSAPRYLELVESGQGDESACLYCGCPIVVVTVHGADVAVDFDGHLHRGRCPEMRRRHRARRRARERAGGMRRDDRMDAR